MNKKQNATIFLLSFLLVDLFSFSVVLQAHATSGSGTFGYTAYGDEAIYMNSTSEFGYFSTPAGLDTTTMLSNITVGLYTYAPTETISIAAAIYYGNGTLWSTTNYVTTSITGDGSAIWITCPFSPELSLAPSTNYYLSAYSNDSANTAYACTSDAGSDAYNSGGMTYPNFPSDISGYSNGSNAVSIYGNYYSTATASFRVQSNVPINYTIDSVPYQSNVTYSIALGNYTIVAPSIYAYSLGFNHWEDATTNNIRLLSFLSDTIWTATYTLSQPQTQITNGNFVANVSTTKSLRWAHKSIFTVDRYWLFYTDVYPGNPSDGEGLETSSFDSTMWTKPTIITGPYQLEHPYGTCLEVLLDHNGLIHTIIRARNSTSSTVDLFYRVGRPFGNGTIEWLTDWQDFWQGKQVNADPFMALDSKGYPCVSWSEGSDLIHTYPYVMKSDMKNGTWHTAPGYPIKLTSAPYTTNSFLVPLSNNRMLTFYFSAPGIIYSKLIDTNNSIGSEETVTSSNIWAEYPFGHESWARSAVVDANDNVFLVFISDSMSIQFTERINLTGSWTAETTIQTDVINSANPSLILYNHLLQCFWVYDSNNIAFKNFGNGVWDSQPTIAVQSFSALIPNIYELGYSGVMSSFVQYAKAGTGLYWIMNTTTPGIYQIRFADFNAPSQRVLTYTTVTASADSNSMINPSGSVQVSYGDSQTFNYSANAGYSITSVLVDGNNVSITGNYTFSNVASNHRISVSTSINQYAITDSHDSNSLIAPSGNIQVNYGSNQFFNYSAINGYVITRVLVDGFSVPITGNYTFSNVQADHTISVFSSARNYTPSEVLVLISFTGTVFGVAVYLRKRNKH